MFRDTLTVYRKEIKSILKDKTVLFMCVLLPFIFMFGEGKLMSAMSVDTTEEKTFNAYVVNAPAEIKDGLKSIGFSDENVNVDKVLGDIKNKNADILAVFPEDFKIAADGSAVSNIEVYYNSSRTDSLLARERLSTLLDTLRPVVFTINADTAKTYDLGDEDYQAKNFIASMVPGLLLLTIVYGIMALASNIIAGDKETGFLNTVLITPVSRTSVALGKALAVMTAAAISSVSSFVGLSFLMKDFQKMMGDAAVSYAMSDYFFVFVTIICVTFALVSLILVISTLAKTARAAQTLTMLPAMILFIGSMITTNASFEHVLSSFGFKHYFIPMWNATYLTKNILLTGFEMKEMLVTCGVNITFGLLCLYLVSYMFNQEKIVNE
ncbi:MAG: ABC transporter permease [Clostridiales bacterium]|nr:ABC transporter permease [Clostridiales bacterium]MCR5274193.1 ABC transporter permease [Clostridiales bacterium]